MKSGKTGVDHARARSFAIENGVVGAGWGLDDSSESETVADGSGDLEAYLAAARRAFPGDASLEVAANCIGRAISDGDFCWMYDTASGEYWCSVVTGPFVYRQGAGFDEFDLHILRPCRWARVGAADAVPGVVRRAFAASFGTVTRLTTGVRSAQQAAEVALGLASGAPNDFFAAASPDDLEDVVGLYLQSLGWRVLPSTSKTSMASYEYVLVDQHTGARAGVQVKSGCVGAYKPVVADDFDRFFVLLAHAADRLVTSDERVERIGRSQIEMFAALNWPLLPRRLQRLWAPVTQV
jgi:hypothetical protein